MKRGYRKHQMERWSVGALERAIDFLHKSFRACIAAGPELY